MKVRVATMLLLGLLAQASFAHPQDGKRQISLNDGWTLQPECSAEIKGEAISARGFEPHDAMHIDVPSTVVAAQVKTGKFKNIFMDRNLRNLPGMAYPIGENFENLPMPADSPYHCGWWYRKEFPVAQADARKRLTLHFAGINYRANIWLNGKLIADSSKIAGAYRVYDLDVTDAAKPGAENVLAIETFAPTETDLGVNWVDWNPAPPDKELGITGAVSLIATGPVLVSSPLVTTHFEDGSLASAKLTAFVDVENHSEQPIHGSARISLLGMHLEQPVDLGAGEHKTVIFASDHYPQLQKASPPVWWPYAMGTPRLEDGTAEFLINGTKSDEQSFRFGIREVTSKLTDTGARLFQVNGKPILIRGGGWSQDMLLRQDEKKLREEFALVRDLNLNTIRLEGKLETEDFFKLADEQGILVMAGWCCCDQWEHWDKWTPENHQVAEASLRSQMLRMRNHPSLLVWLNGSDNPPPTDVEQTYLSIEQEMHWPNPTLSSATGQVSKNSGNSGVKMSGPYDFVAPSYWTVDTKQYGGGFGFNTETSPGPAIPNESSLRKFLSPDKLWPMNDDWAYHNGSEGFKDLTVFNDALKVTYGPANSLDEYERESQAMAYDGERAMFEAYARNKYTSTGVVQWMLNNAWPSTIWHLFDYYLDAGGGYYGAKKACEPMHIQYSYDDHSVFVVNSTYEAAAAVKASARVYDLKLKTLYSAEESVTPGADSSTKVMAIPDTVFSSDAPVYLVQLSLHDASGKALSENFYWVPAKLTTFNWAKTDYTHTPALTQEDMTTLKSLAPATVQVKVLSDGDDRKVKLVVKNTSSGLAMLVALRAQDAHGEAIDPVFWSDNYVSLMPGETREIEAGLFPEETTRIRTIAVSGWNVAPQKIALGAKKETEKNVAER